MDVYSHLLERVLRVQTYNHDKSSVRILDLIQRDYGELIEDMKRAEEDPLESLSEVREHRCRVCLGCCALDDG